MALANVAKLERGNKHPALSSPLLSSPAMSSLPINGEDFMRICRTLHANDRSLHLMRSLWSPYVIGQAIIFLPCGFFYLSIFFFFFSSPNLRGRRLDVYYTSTQSVASVQIWNVGLKRAARGSLKYRTQKVAIWAPSHKFVGLYLRNEGTYRQSEKTG